MWGWVRAIWKPVATCVVIFLTAVQLPLILLQELISQLMLLLDLLAERIAVSADKVAPPLSMHPPAIQMGVSFGPVTPDTAAPCFLALQKIPCRPVNPVGADRFLPTPAVKLAAHRALQHLCYREIDISNVQASQLAEGGVCIWLTSDDGCRSVDVDLYNDGENQLMYTSDVDDDGTPLFDEFPTNGDLLAHLDNIVQWLDHNTLPQISTKPEA